MGTYSFKDVVATIAGPGGVIPLANEAGAAEEGITLAMREDVNTMVIGADGSVMHSLHAGQGAHATIRILKTSPTNALLAAMYQLQRQSSGTHGNNVISVVDVSRGDTYTCQQVAFKKFPDNLFAKGANIIEWTFDVGFMTGLLGAGVPDVNV